MGAIWIKEKVCFIKFYTWYNIFVELTSSLLTPQNREKKQIARLKVCSPFKINHYMYVWLVCKSLAKILLSEPETSLMTLCLFIVEAITWTITWWKPQMSQLSGSSQNVLKRLGRSGQSYGNQALHCIYLPLHNKHLEISIFKMVTAEFHLQLYANIKRRSQA